MNIKLQSKPKRPIRGMKEYKLAIYEGDSFDHIRAQVPKGVNAVVDWQYEYCETDLVFIKWKVLESLEEFEDRMQRYYVKINKYKTWYKENKKEIEEELARREKIAKEKHNKALATHEVKLKKELERIERQRKTICGQLKQVERKGKKNNDA